MEIAELLMQWDTGLHKPFKGSLIDEAAYNKDPGDPSCMCAQGQVLHLIGGWSANRLMSSDQAEADTATAKLLGISYAHAVLLRQTNDSVDGAPSIVLTNPEQVLGEQAQTVLAFWRHLDAMSARQWSAAENAGAALASAAWDVAWDAAGAAAGAAARAVAGAAAQNVARAAAEAASRTVARAMAWAAAGAWAVAGTVAGAAAGAAAGAGAAARATNEIQGAAVMRAKGQRFYFLPMFGFADPQAII